MFVLLFQWQPLTLFLMDIINVKKTIVNSLSNFNLLYTETLAKKLSFNFINLEAQ